MSVRFDLNCNYRQRYTIATWMTEKFGPPEEGKTWFWSTKDYQEYNSKTKQYDNKCQDGIEIWASDSKNITVAMLKWSA